MGYTINAIKGVSWLGMFRVVFRGFTFIKIAILARFLTPNQFGEADIVIIILAMVEIFTETGINVFLVQLKEDIDEFINTAWFVSIIRGFIIAILIFLLSNPISNFFNSPQSKDLLVIASLIPLIRGFINPSIVKLLKNLEYGKHFFYRSSIVFVEITSTILIILITSQPSGIVYGLISGALWEVILTMFIAFPKPKLSFNYNKFKKVLNTGKWLTLSGIFDYLYLNLDNIFIGRLLGTGALGLYMRSYSISLLPITEVSDVFNQSTFPIYVKIADNTKRLKNAYFKTLIIVFSLVLPIGIIFFIFPEQIVKIILGDKWIEIVSVLKILIIYGVIRAILRTTIGLFYSLKKQEIITRITFISLLGMVITIIPFINKWGIIGAGLSAITGTLVSVPVVIYYAYVLLNRTGNENE